jgi:hypothetical protein
MTPPGKLSVMIGLKPTGLSEFIEVAKPCGLYSINNSVAFPGVEVVLRVQNDIWRRLPDAVGLDRYFEIADPIASARYELLNEKDPHVHQRDKLIAVPKLGNLNLIEFWKLSKAAYYAPYNEWVLGEGDDRFAKADWMNAWTCEAQDIAHAHGLKLCIGSFATRNPVIDVLPNLLPMLKKACANGDLLDVHEYGITSGLMAPGNSQSGALYYRELYRNLPPEAQPDLVISEFWWGNGFEEHTSVQAQIADAVAYGRELCKDRQVRWAAAFQLDQGAESHIGLNALRAYASAAAQIVYEEPIEPEEPEAKVVTIARQGLDVTARVDLELGRGQVVVLHASDVTIELV